EQSNADDRPLGIHQEDEGIHIVVHGVAREIRARRCRLFDKAGSRLRVERPDESKAGSDFVGVAVKFGRQESAFLRHGLELGENIGVG
ncbi:MAG TPA: hypothetical protein VMM36_19275, partial [Opitutaceae bacterium]|nr:hypothetical protein [Opitutaceae bacterium]